MEPSAQPTCQPSSEPSREPTSSPSDVASLDFTSNIANIVVTAISSSSIHAAVSLEWESTVHCGVFLHESDNSTRRLVNVTAVSIRHQNWVCHTFTSEAEINITGLIPSTAYDLYCMTTSLDEMFEMAQPNILGTKTHFTLPCCDSVQVSFASRYIFQSTQMTEIADVEIDLRQVPMGHELVVNIAATLRNTGAITSTSVALGMRHSRILKRLSNISTCVPSFDVFPAEISFNGSSSAVFLDDRTAMPSTVGLVFSSLCPGRFIFNISVMEKIRSPHSIISRETTVNPSIIELFVLGANSTVPSPHLLSASIISSGEVLELIFDSYTDMGGLGGKYFSCDLLLVVFDSTSSPICFWQHSTRLKVILGPASNVGVGNTLLLKGGRIASRYTASSVVAAVNMSISSQLSITPKVRISAPAVLSVFAPLSLDLRSSSGSGGRQWSNVSISVRSMAANVDAINLFYNRNLSSPLERLNSLLPRGSLLVGQSYVFDFTLCTFWGACAHSSHKVLVTSSYALPIIIAGSAYKQITRSSSVSLQVVPQLQSSGFVSASSFLKLFNPIYTMEVFVGSVRYASTAELTVMISNEIPAIFSLPAFYFPSNKVFRIKISLRSGTTGSGVSTSFTECFLNVVPSPLVAKLSVIGSAISLRQGENVELHGHESYDSDMCPHEIMTVTSPYLSVSWECVVVTSNLTRISGLDGSGSSFGISGWRTPVPCQTFGSSSSSSNVHPVALLGSTGQSTGDIMRVILTVRSNKPNDLRFDFTSVDITVVMPSAPLLTVTSGDMKSNINDELVLPATVVASKSGSVRWSLSGSPFINIHESAISLTEFAISPFVPTMIFYTDLILPSNLLSAGVWYTFTLTFYPDDKRLEVYSSSVTIKTNRGPQPGVFSVSPNQGEAFVTLYLMSATFWDSPHLPLRYSFGYFSEDALAISLQVGEYPTKATRLPAGRVERAYGLTCIVTVLDNLGFYSVMNRSVIVNPTTLNETDLIEILDAELPPEVVQAVLDVNCSLAPSCASLNRRNCSSMAHTCGACLSLQYVGVIGSSNTQCVIIEEVLEPDDVILDINITNSTTDSTTDGVIDWECFDNSMCPRFKICEGFRCLPVAKACPIHCPSDRGACAYITTATSLVVDRCYVGDTACVAVCRCVEGWSGPTCSVDYEELEQATFLVSDILCTLAKEAIFASESKRIESADVALWVSQLRFLSQESSSLRLSADSAICTMTVLTIILENSLLVNMTLSQLQVVWDTMDVLLHFKQYFDYSVISLFPYHKELTGNMSSTLQLFCQTVHLLPEPTIPVLSKQNNLLLKLETNLTSPSSLDICHTVSPIAFMERKGPLSSDFCAVRCEPQVFNVNLTMMLESEVLEVKPPATINDTAELIISVACVADTSPPTLSPQPPPPRAFCELDDISWKELLCANGTAAISCNGLASYNVSCIDVNHIFSFDCPHLYCVVVEKISDMMCQCSLPVSDRFVSVSIDAVIISVAQDFHATLSGADVLSERGKWKTVVTLTLIVLLFALGLWIVHMVDRSQALRVARDIQEREQRDREMIDLEKDEERIAMLQSTFVARDVYATFPSIFNKDSMGEVFVGELKKSHRWASLLFHYHPQRPRSLRFVVLTTLVTCTLFLNALFFKVSHYELDHDCEQFLSQQKCTEETSPFSTTTSKCFWEHQDHSCYSKQLDSEVSALWLMMLAVAVFSIPIVIILELAVDWVLVRPTASGGCLSQKLSSVFPAPETLSNCLGATIEGGDSQMPGEEKVVNGSLYDFVDLISLVIDYRTSLSVNDCKVFDKRWGFPSTLHSIDMDLELDMYLKHLRTREAEADGRVNLYDDAERNDVFVEGPLFAVFDQILEEIKHSRLYASREIHLLNHISEQNKGKRLLELFQKDLLIGIKVDIVTNLRYEDKLEDTSDCVLRPIHVWVKALCLSVIATINIFFLTYVFLFSMNQDKLGQAAFLRVFCMWLATCEPSCINWEGRTAADVAQ